MLMWPRFCKSSYKSVNFEIKKNKFIFYVGNRTCFMCLLIFKPQPINTIPAIKYYKNKSNVCLLDFSFRSAYPKVVNNVERYIESRYFLANFHIHVGNNFWEKNACWFSGRIFNTRKTFLKTRLVWLYWIIFIPVCVYYYFYGLSIPRGIKNELSASL